MEFTFTLGLAGWIVLIVGAAVFGLVAPLFGRSVQYEWLVGGVAAFIGALVASEFVIAWQAFEPVFDGVALIPALVGGLVIGIAAVVVLRLASGSEPTGRTLSA
jgi:hypothetical protein